jgi:rubrerythrin
MDKCCLKWNEFGANIMESFSKLRKEQRLFDVTLASDDGQHIKAHKMILSAGSDFFSDIFMKSEHNNILIYLKGITSAQLQNVIEFMYNGEANISQEELTVFLETARELQVKGLDGEIEDIDKNESEKHEINDQDIKISKNEVKCENDENKDAELVDCFDTTGVTFVAINKINHQINANYEILDETEQIEKNDGLWKCKVCGKTAAKRSNMRRHAETHIVGMSHVCHICSKISSTRHNLRSHIFRTHSESFSCKICGKSGMNRAAYTNHKLKNHEHISFNLNL